MAIFEVMRHISITTITMISYTTLRLPLKPGSLCLAYPSPSFCLPSLPIFSIAYKE